MNRTINTDLFQASHGHQPRGRGWWAFRNLLTNEEQVVADELYGTAVRSLPKGDWKVLP